MKITCFITVSELIVSHAEVRKVNVMGYELRE